MNYRFASTLIFSRFFAWLLLRRQEPARATPFSARRLALYLTQPGPTENANSSQRLNNRLSRSNPIWTKSCAKPKNGSPSQIRIPPFAETGASSSSIVQGGEKRRGSVTFDAQPSRRLRDDQVRRELSTASQAAKWLGREGPPQYVRPTGCPAQPRPPCDN